MNESDQRDTALRRLARLYGVQTEYRAMGGALIEAKPHTLRAVLAALGVDAHDPDVAITQRRHALWHWRMQPVLVAWEGTLSRIDLRLPVSDVTGAFSLHLDLDNGGSRSAEGDLLSLPALTHRYLNTQGTLQMRGVPGFGDHEQTVYGQTDRYVKLALPGFSNLPHGYHRLSLEAGDHHLESLVISAPRRVYSGPARHVWGAFLPLYALHSQRSWGLGDLTDLEGLVDWSASCDAHFAGTLPLLASFLDKPLEPSPYAPVSRLFWNELFIDPARPLVPPQPPGADAFDMQSVASEIARLNQQELVPYAEAMALKRRVLEQQLESLTPEQRDAMQRYADARPVVRDYARWRAAVQKHGANWRVWPEPASRGDLSNLDLPRATEDYYTYAQWCVDTQMRDLAQRSHEKDVPLYLDLPVGVHPDGYDAWRYQDQFVAGVSVGAPPDVVTTSGQDWGFAPLSPDVLRRDGYRYVIDYLRAHFEVAGVLRVDHAMGFHRLYWVPHGAGAQDGVYVRYPADELYAVLCLESQRAQSAVVFENLGIVTAAMDRAFIEHGVKRMYVLSIDLHSDHDPPFREVPRDVVASLGTHDLPMFTAWWRSDDIEQRVALRVLSEERAEQERNERWLQHEALVAYLQREGLLENGESVEDVLHACLALLARSDAQYMLVNLEDLWLEDKPQNVPGTMADKYPNWRRRARYSLEELRDRFEVRDAIDVILENRAAAENT